MEPVDESNKNSKEPARARIPTELNRHIVGYTGTSINIANAMAGAMRSGALPSTSGSNRVNYDSDNAPRKESQHTLGEPRQSDEPTNVKVSGGKRKKPATPRRGVANKEVKSKMIRQGKDDQETNVDFSDVEREIKSRRLMSPAEALLDSAQAVIPAPGLHERHHSRNGSAALSNAGMHARRQTTFTLRPPREGSVEHGNGGPSDGRVHSRARASLSPEAAAANASGAGLINRYGNGRRHRTSQSPGSVSTTTHYNSFSAIVATGRSGITGMDTTVEEDESMDSGETSGASASRQNTTSMSVSALHDESSYEAMEREVQAKRTSETASTFKSGQTYQTPRQALFTRPLTASSHNQGESTNTLRQPFFPIPESLPESQITASGQKRRAARKSVDNQAYRPEGGVSSKDLLRETRAATDSADEDGGGEGLAAHLPERSTRGKRHEQGEGYLGTGLSFVPNSSGKAKSKKNDSGRTESGEAEEVEIPDDLHEHEDHVESLKSSLAPSRGRGAKFNTPARSRKSVSVGLSPLKDIKSEAATTPKRPEPVNNKASARAKASQFQSTAIQYLSNMRQKAWLEPLKWFGIVGGLLVILWWLVTHAPTEISEIERRSAAGTRPSGTGVWTRESPHHPGSAMQGNQDGMNEPMDRLLGRLSDFESAFALLSGRVAEMEIAHQRSQEEVDIAHTTVKRMDEDLRSERNKREHAQRDADQLRTALDSVRQQAEVSTSSLSTTVEELSRKVDSFESGMKEALSEQRMMKLLERVLPSGVPVRREPKTGDITIDPSFWTELRKVMATKSDVDSLTSKVSAIKKKQDADKSSPPTTSAVAAKIPTWQDFLDENEERLRTCAEKTFDRKMVDAEVVDRVSFMSMLKEELHALQATMRDEASTREESTMAKINKDIRDIRSRATESAASPVIATGDVDADIKPVLQRLIDDSLLKYSKDILAKPDYALASGGAQILHDQTSKTMDLVRDKSVWSWLSGERSLGLSTTGRMPEVVLHPNTQPGMCWPFTGSAGEVGILLSREVRVTDITVEHAARELVSAKSLMSAPKDMELWAYFNEDRVEEVEQFLESNPAYQADLEPPRKAERMILLSRFQYSPHTVQPIQSFPVHGDIQALNLVTENVILKINGNWGADYTCLYRVRVHGEAEEDFGEDVENVRAA